MRHKTVYHLLIVLAGILLTAEITYDLTAWSQLEMVARVSNYFFWGYLIYFFLIYEKTMRDKVPID